MILDSAVAGVTGAKSMELALVVTELPWRDDFVWWAGIDAATGTRKGTAVFPTHVRQAESGKSHEDCSVIGSDRELGLEVASNFADAYNIGGVEETPLSRYLNGIEYCDTTVSIIAKYSMQDSRYGEPPAGMPVRLTNEAEELADSPQDFRREFGDYFVCGARCGCQYAAVYRCHSEHMSDLHRFTAMLRNFGLDLFSERGALAFEKVAADNGVETALAVIMAGLDGAPSPSEPRRPSDVPEHLDWFKLHMQAVPLYAKLMHYQGIETRIPPRIPVEPSVFDELRVLYRTVWEVHTHYRACPGEAQRDLAGPYDDFNMGVTANRWRLAHNTGMRRAYMRRAAFLKRHVRDVLRTGGTVDTASSNERTSGSGRGMLRNAWTGLRGIIGRE